MSKPSFLDAYLKPFRALLEASDVVEIVLNPDGGVWVERQGAAFMEQVEELHMTPEDAQNLAQSIASHVEVQFGDKKPVVSGKIVTGGQPVRAQVIAKPIVEGGAALSLRRYSTARIDLERIGLIYDGLINLDERRRARAGQVVALAGAGKLDAAMMLCVQDRLNVLISGGTSTGKTTFARALLALVDKRERIVTIEDAYELFPEQKNSVALRADRIGGSERTPAKLLEASLRMRPDRIILGELRGDEAKTFLEAINTGHGGSFSTIHADTARKAIDRLALMVMSTGLNMSFAEVRRYCRDSIDVVVQLAREAGKRGVAEVYVPGLSVEHGDA